MAGAGRWISPASSRCSTASDVSIVLYDLKGRDGLRYSPYCWRIRYALAHKGLEIENVAVGFTEK